MRKRITVFLLLIAVLMNISIDPVNKYFVQLGIENVWAETTVNFTGDISDDGSLIKQNSSVYPPNTSTYEVADSLLRAEKSYNGTYYKVQTLLFGFDTSSIPDTAEIRSAMLTIYPYTNSSNTNDRNLNCEYYYYSNVADLSNYTDTVGTSAFTRTLTGLARQYTEIPLSNVNNINKTGFTGFRFGISGGQPTGTNSLEIYGSAFGAGPKLSVTYGSLPTTPTITTPNGGDTYDKSVNISWSSSTDADGDALTYDLEFSADNGATWSSIITGVSGTSYTWDCSTKTESTTALVRIRANDGYGYSNYDQSDAAFTIWHNQNPTISVTGPSANGTLQPRNVDIKGAA